MHWDYDNGFCPFPKMFLNKKKKRYFGKVIMYILVVDDEKDIRNLLQMTLEKTVIMLLGQPTEKSP